jgi:hypothetical protein
MKPVIFALAALVIAGPVPTRVAAPPRRPYSCRLFDDARRQCAIGQCDQSIPPAMKDKPR